MSAEFTNLEPHADLHGMDAMGHPVPHYRRENAYQWLRAIEVPKGIAWATVAATADRLERDKPYDAMTEASRTVDLTGAYRLIAMLLTGSPAPVAVDLGPALGNVAL